MKIVLYTRRNVGLYCLSHLIAMGHEVRVMTDDEDVKWLCDVYACRVIENGDWKNVGLYDLFLCVHGDKIIPKNYIVAGRMINVHPCLISYPGHNPIKKYIENKGVVGSVSTQWLINEVDKGEIIHTEWFDTPGCKTYADFYNIALPYYFKAIQNTLEKIA